MKKYFTFALLSFVSISTFAQTKEDIKMFPNAEENYIQKVIRLEPKDDENNYMVEIMIGKKTITDSCNNYFLIGKLEEKNLEGWGYNYYNFTSTGDVASTLKGCMNSKSIEKIVYAENQKVRYNSRLPIIIYTPKGYEVNYRIWSASDGINTAK